MNQKNLASTPKYRILVVGHTKDTPDMTLEQLTADPCIGNEVKSILLAGCSPLGEEAGYDGVARCTRVGCEQRA